MDPNSSIDFHGPVPHSNSSGFVILSYLVSLAGCWSTVELLHRRTGTRGYYNWYLLLAASTTMGAVGTWCMHFIGNRAIVMDKGQPNVQIQYSPGFTAGSFFVPIVVVGFAFYIFNVSDRVSILGTLVGGFLTGLAICGMHYMGQGGIANYVPSYSWHYVLGSAIVAVAAATAALGVFFYLKSTWTNSWWKRAFCACMLACAVSGMHWIATVGTQYRLKPGRGDMKPGLSREATVIVVIFLSLGCCMSLIAFALIGQRSRKRSADRAQQVVLTCATFDSDGRLMVTPDGLLPCRKITDSYNDRSFEDVFDVDHPVFCWIFRASHCWRSVAPLIPGIRAHLQCTMPVKPSSRSELSGSRLASGAGRWEDYSTLFKELFCVAAKDLADLIQEPLEDIGVLHGKIMSTGTLSKTEKLKRHGLKMRNNALDVAERGESPVVFGRGQLLFVVRQANRFESSRLQAAGHRFATIPNVIENLARSMEVTREELLPQLESMRLTPVDDHTFTPGVHLACFALRPVFHRGFDVLVRKDAGNMLPSTFLSSSKLEQWQLDILERMDNLTVSTCCDLLRKRRMLVEEREHQFADDLLEGIRQLQKKINDPFFGDARLIARPVRAPCNSLNQGQAPPHAFLVTFRSIVDAHQQSSLNDRFEYVPLKFFLCQQHAYRRSPDNRVFARKIHQEFGALARHPEDYTRRGSTNSTHHEHNGSSVGSLGAFPVRSPSPAKKKGWPYRVPFKGFDIKNDNSSEKNNLVKLGAVQPYGGIHVSNDIDIDVSEIRPESHSIDIEMKDYGFHSEAGVGDVECDSFADELVAMMFDERRKQHTSRN